MRSRHGRRAAATAAAVLVLGLASGCSGSGDEASSGAMDPASAAGDVPAEAAPGRAVVGVTPEGASDTSKTGSETRTDGQTVGSARVPVTTRQTISTGSVTLHGKDLAPVRTEIDRLLGRFGGFVADERTRNERDGSARSSVLELRVPSNHFEDLMSAFADVATVTDVRREVTDVTSEVIDVDARVRTAEVSLRRLRGFLGEAADLEDTIRLESEIAQREADLGSLMAQQRYLADQTSLASITVTLTQNPAVVPPQETDRKDDAGFLTGLHHGWRALLDILLVGATVLGAVLPFAVLGAVLAVPAWLVLRSTRRRRPLSPAEPV